MASPQVENGHTDIAHELMVALCQVDLSNNEYRVILALLRKTYGWHKKNDGIALSQYSELTQMKPQHILRNLVRLEQRKMIILHRQGRGKLTTYQFQKDYSQWLDKELLPIQVIPEQVIPKQVSTITHTGNKLLPKQVITKETTKETIQKEKRTPIISDNNKKPYGELSNVLLTDVEYDKLTERFGKAGIEDRIAELSLALASKGYKYKSHYATVLSWDRRDKKEHPPTRDVNVRW